MIVVANWRPDNVKSPAAMLQEKTGRKAHALRDAGGSLTCRTYLHTQGVVGYLFSYFEQLLYVRKRNHTTVAQLGADLL